MSAADMTSYRVRRQLSLEDWVMRAAVVALIVLLLLIVLLPLWSLLVKSFEDGDGRFVGLANYARYFSTPSLYLSLWNSVWVAALSTAIVVPLAFAYAYALTRTAMPLKGFFMALALLPIFAPSLLPAISLIYMFGTQGFAKGLLFGHSVYGPIGIVIAQVFYCFPHAAMILVTALSLADQRLYEAADVLGATRWRRFMTVTLPGAKYGLVGASFVVFTLVVTDFGIAKVIGGQFNVLATDAYKQVVGQQNFQMGAVVGMVLLAPAVLAFVVDRLVQRRQVSLLSARAVPYIPKPAALKDAIATLYCAVIGGLLLFVLLVSAWASLITRWPYNLSFSWRHYNFAETEPTGWDPYFTSIWMSALATTAGTALIFLGAYLIEKGRGFQGGRALAQMIAMLPMAVPGLVLGLGYVFFFNAKWNPLNVLYGTVLILAINSIAHFYTTAHVTAVTALKQIDREFESVSQSLKVPFWRTLRRVTAPIAMPAILDIWVYMFVNAMTTVSAVIFLYGAQNKLASIAIVHMEEEGRTEAAAAMATLIVLTALAVKLAHLLAEKLVFSRLQAWRKR